MPPRECEGCLDCGTTYATHAGGHKPIAPHDFQAQPVRYADQPGTTITRCSKCYRTKHAIDTDLAQHAAKKKG